MLFGVFAGIILVPQTAKLEGFLPCFSESDPVRGASSVAPVRKHLKNHQPLFRDCIMEGRNRSSFYSEKFSLAVSLSLYLSLSHFLCLSFSLFQKEKEKDKETKRDRERERETKRSRQREIENTPVLRFTCAQAIASMFPTTSTVM